MRLSKRLLLLVSLALSALALSAGVAFATGPGTSTPAPSTPGATITVNGAAPSGTYQGTATNPTLTSDGASVDCTSSSTTFTIDANGDGNITNLSYSNCTSGGLNCTVAVTVTDGTFTVTNNTQGSGGTWVLNGNISGNVTCPFGITCTFTNPTGDDEGTVPFRASVTEGAPGALTFTDVTVDNVESVCTNADMSATYVLDDPTTTPGAGTTASTPGGTADTRTTADDLTVSP